MKAVQFANYGDPDVLQVRDVSDPTPDASDVLVQVKATTVNRLDLFQRDGSRPVEKLPFTPGLEAAGVVVSDANGFHAGERVMTTRARHCERWRWLCQQDSYTGRPASPYSRWRDV